MTNDLPDTMTLTSSRLKTFGLLLICLIFVATGLWMTTTDPENKLMGWFCAAFFGLGLPVFIMQLLRPGHLTLSKDGFEQVILGRTLACKWTEVSEFGIVKIKRNKFVSFSRYEDEGKMLAGISKSMTGGASGMLGDNFGMKTTELAMLMNDYRVNAMRKVL